MGDGTRLNPGEGGDLILTDEVGAFKVEVAKVGYGLDGELTHASTTNPLPTVDATAAAKLVEAIEALEATLKVEVLAEASSKADGGEGLPATVKIIGGYDGTNTQALATDASGMLQVDVANEPTVAVTGVSTAAKQDSQTTLLTEIESAVDGTEALLTTIDADTSNLAGILTSLQTLDNIVAESEAQVDIVSGGPLTSLLEAIKTSVEVIDNAISGTEMQVDVLTLPAIPAGTNNIGDVDVLSLPATPTGTNSIGKIKSIEEALPAGTNAIGKLAANSGVDIGDVTLTEGSAAIGKLAANSGVDIGDVDVKTIEGGTKAHDEADAGNPVKVGARARTALPAAVAQDDRTDNISDKHGRQLVTEFPRDQKLEGRLNLTNTTETTILEAAGASTKWVVTGIIVTNSSATVETKVEIKDDTTAKVIVHAGTKGGGAAPPCPPGGFFIGTENKTVKVKAVTTGADVEVFVCGYKVPA